MSDIEEPAAKVCKMETSSQGTDEDLEGQEEWLSEEVLTDDDGNVVVRKGETANPKAEVITPDFQDTDTQDGNIKKENVTKTDDIEQALDNMENSNDNNGFSEDLGAFLVRKESEAGQDSDIEESNKQSEDDGNSTDELLRMLGDDNKAKMKGSKKAENAQDTTEDDEYNENVNENKSMKILNVQSNQDSDDNSDNEEKSKQLKLAREIIRRATAVKAEPEGMSDSSSDEAHTVKKMFGVNKKTKNTHRKPSVIRPTLTVTKKVITVDKKKDKPAVKTISHEVKTPLLYQREIKTSSGGILRSRQAKIKREQDSQDSMDDEKQKKRGQAIMKPEEMDEEIPSDCESYSEEDSLFEDFVSSEEEDIEDWFTIDIRDEKAGNYIPLLGSNALKLLTKEKERIAEKIASLKEDLSSLNSLGKAQAEQLKKATATLAELDATLKVS